MKKIAILALLVFIVAAFAGCGGAKVGTVDPVKIMQTSIKMKNYQNEFQGKIKVLQDQMGKEAQGLDQAGQQKKQQEFINKANAEKQGFEQKIETELKAVMQTVAKDKGFDMVMAKEVLYVGGTDMTDDVLKKLDEGAVALPAATPAVSGK
ncbi:MAG: OmpH family outer membrane protein [Negativicutes bacterium]|jgi:outer membrane protein